MPATRPVRFSALTCILFAASASVDAQDVKRPTLEQIEGLIDTRNPQVRVEKVDQERIIVRRIDVVDENGVIRMVLGAPTPAPILDGIQYKRAFAVSGVTFFDENGSERGGVGVADIPGGAAVLALDHPNMDAIGWRVMPDGSVQFGMNERPPMLREPGLGDRLVPGIPSSKRISLKVAPDGSPSIALADKEDRPRLRLIVTEEGFGAIEFLDADGKVVEQFAPEKTRAARAAERSSNKGPIDP